MEYTGFQPSRVFIEKLVQKFSGMTEEMAHISKVARQLLNI